MGGVPNAFSPLEKFPIAITFNILQGKESSLALNLVEGGRGYVHTISLEDIYLNDLPKVGVYVYWKGSANIIPLITRIVMITHCFPLHSNSPARLLPWVE